MLKQDTRVKASEEDIESFQVLASVNENELIKEMLNKNPTLIYSLDGSGHTALHCVVASGKEADLETVKILIEYGAEPEKSHAGRALQLIKDPVLMQDMARIIYPDIQLKDYSKASDIVERTQEYLNTQRNRVLKGIGKKDATLTKKLNSSEWPIMNHTNDGYNISSPYTPTKPMSGRSRRNSI